MSVNRGPDTRQRLLTAATELVAASPGQDIPLRAICDRVGVKLPTLYHFFGSKEGLLAAVVEHGFDLYLDIEKSRGSTGDVIQDLRGNWDDHLRFGLENPGFYVLMYGQVAPGRSLAAQKRPTAIVCELTLRAEEENRLVVSAHQAAAHLLAANIGVTLRQVVLAEDDPELSAAMREATISAITGTCLDREHGLADAANQLLNAVSANGHGLGAEETALLRRWIIDISRQSST